MEVAILKSIHEEKFSSKFHNVKCSIPKIGEFLFVELAGTHFPQYKYIDKRWASAFFEDGQMRIGTLHDFSRVDLHGDRRGDLNEGARNYHQLDDGPFPIVVSTSSLNSYTYCTSRVLSKEIAEEFQSDCAIEITSIHYFIEISKIMDIKYEIVSSSIGPINYVDNEDVVNCVFELLDAGWAYDEMKAHMPDFARLKDRQFSSQAEVRAIWEPASPSAKHWPAGRPSVPSDRDQGISPYDRHHSPVNERIQAVFPKVPNARHYCRLIEF